MQEHLRVCMHAHIFPINNAFLFPYSLFPRTSYLCAKKEGVPLRTYLYILIFTHVFMRTHLNYA